MEQKNIEMNLTNNCKTGFFQGDSRMGWGLGYQEREVFCPPDTSYLYVYKQELVPRQSFREARKPSQETASEVTCSAYKFECIHLRLEYRKEGYRYRKSWVWKIVEVVDI